MLGRRGSDAVSLTIAGLFTGWLALDDMLMLHDDALPVLGIPEKVTYAVYGATLSLYLFVSSSWILANRPMLMAAALGFFGASVAIDLFIHSPRPGRVFLEDGAKFLGILAWTGYHLTAALASCTAALAPRRSPFVTDRRI